MRLRALRGRALGLSCSVAPELLSGSRHPVTIADVQAGAACRGGVFCGLPLRRVRAALPARSVAAAGNPSALCSRVLHFVPPSLVPAAA